MRRSPNAERSLEDRARDHAQGIALLVTHILNTIDDQHPTDKILYDFGAYTQ